MENSSSPSEEFILLDFYCVVAPDLSHPDSIWFIKIIDTLETNVKITDDYENKIAPGKSCIEGRFMEKLEVSAKGFSRSLLFIHSCNLYRLKKDTICQCRICWNSGAVLTVTDFCVFDLGVCDMTMSFFVVAVVDYYELIINLLQFIHFTCYI